GARAGRLAVDRPPPVDLAPDDIHQGGELPQQRVVLPGRARLGRGQDHAPAPPVRHAAVLVPDLLGLQLDLGVLVPEQVDQVRVGLLAGLLEPPLLDLPVEGLPLGGVLAGPTATGLRPPVDFLGDGLPRVADGTYLGGGGQQGLDVRAHDGVLFPRSKCAGRFAATRRLCGAERVGGGKWGGAAGMDVAARDVQTSLRSFPRLSSLSGQNFSNPRKRFVDSDPSAWRTARVSASTQNQAFSALLFLYRDVLQVDPGRIDGVIRANRPKRLPVVLTRNEVRRVLSRLDGTYRLMGQLMYGSGLRLLECLRLRVQDI